ncbi:MAG: hypothetical protein ACJAT1_000878 [Marivirga sp.]|jgi:hypothetical protein
MFKFLLILFIIGYVFVKVGGFIFRMFLGGIGAKSAFQQAAQNGQQQQKKRTADGISIDFVPEDKNKRRAKNFRGGEYVEYEELK